MSKFATVIRVGFGIGLFGLFTIFPVAVAAEEAPAMQTIAINDTRAGDGPCGFAIERTIEGTVEVVPSIDAAGNLVLAIEPVSLYGTLTNPATGKSVDLRWIQPNGAITFGKDGPATTVALLLDGHIFRGYDSGRGDLTMSLPADGAERVDFAPGQRSSDPWTHVCGLLG